MNLEYLKIAKKEKKMTLQEIAEKSNIPKRTVDDIFSGHTKNPRTDTIRAIEKALGINSLWNAEDYEFGVTDKKRVWITTAEETWLNYYNELQSVSTQEYDTLCLFIETLIKNKK